MGDVVNIVLKRLGLGVVTLFVISIIIFGAVELLPGDIAQAVLGQGATEENLAAMREQYEREGLDLDDLDPDPIRQFSRWFDDWLATDPYDASSMVLATVDPDGWPAARAVLLKGVDERGFTFFTNRSSDKGRDLAASPRAALTLVWAALERQVRIVGEVEPVATALVVASFGLAIAGLVAGGATRRRLDPVPEP